MNTFSGLVATAAVVSVMSGALPARALATPAEAPTPGGAIVSEVRDEQGMPVAGAVVSAVGRRIVTGVTDESGRCTFTALPAGDYLVRVFSEGHVPVSSLLMIGAPGVRTTWSFVLKDEAGDLDAAEESAPEVLAAGFVGADAAGQPAAAPAGGDSGDDHDHGEVAWRIRHLKRSVLKDAGQAVSSDDYDSTDEFDQAVAAIFERLDGPAGVSASLVSDFPLAGQVNLLTTGAFDSPEQLMSAGTLARGVALVSLGASAGRSGDWSVQGAMTQGDVASWTVSGSYLTRAPANHVIEAGLTYSLQRYDGSNPAALKAVADGDRYASVIYAFDSWTLARRVSLVYGARIANYGYIEKTLFSPRARLTVSPLSRLRVSVGASRRSHAPGAEEFVPSMTAGTWLPPERTFSPLAGTTFMPARTSSFDVAAEHDLSESTLIGLRTFYQATKDQMVTMFGMGSVTREATDLGHYRVASAGDVEARGWSVSVHQVIARRVRGSVDYTVTTAEWRDTPNGAILAARVPGIARSGSERIHDVTTSVETDIPLTDTRVFALYRINTAYAVSEELAVQPGVDARFDVQVRQSLPFLDFTSAQWEMLFGVRNLFRDVIDEASFYDELLTVRPPKRVVGGLTVRF
jgi:hypothetical protein